MKKYDLKFRMTKTVMPKLDALFAALKAAENEEIELVEVQPLKSRATNEQEATNG